MADVQPPKQDDSNQAEEPLIPMPSVAPSTDKPKPDNAQPKITPSASKTTAAAESSADSQQATQTQPTPTPSSQDSKPDASAKTAAQDDTKPTAGSSSLEEIKQKALTELKPLLDEVDLPAEQKFHTILEIISATNDKDLIPKLYEAAEGIEDKHIRAKALVDVVSEIEYLNDEQAN